jgi:multiple sugar transport system substrate-binding protein
MIERSRSHISRRSLLKGTAGLTAAAAFAPNVVRARQFSGSLTVWGVVSFTTEGDELLGQQMKEWGEANGVDVEYVANQGSDYTTKVATAVEAGAVPDVVMMLGDLTHFYADQDRLVDLTDVYNGLKDLAGGMYENLLPHVQVGDKIFSIPMESDLSVMYARLDLIEEATGKRDVPTTLDELEAVAREINAPPQTYGIGLCLGRTPDGAGNVVQLVLSDGGTLVDEQGQPAINNPGTVSALTRIQRWWNDKLIPPDSPSWDDSSNNKAYLSGQAAFVFNPASIFAALEKDDPDLLADTMQAQNPAGSAGSFPTVGTWSWSIFNSSPNIDAAKALITAIMQPDKLEAVYEKVGGRWYPVYRDLANAQFWVDRPFFADFPKIIDSARPVWYPATASPQLLTQLSAVDQKLIYAEMAQDVVVSGKSPEEAAAAAQEKMVLAFQEAAQ